MENKAPIYDKEMENKAPMKTKRRFCSSTGKCVLRIAIVALFALGISLALFFTLGGKSKKARCPTGEDYYCEGTSNYDCYKQCHTAETVTKDSCKVLKEGPDGKLSPCTCVNPAFLVHCRNDNRDICRHQNLDTTCNAFHSDTLELDCDNLGNPTEPNCVCKDSTLFPHVCTNGKIACRREMCPNENAPQETVPEYHPPSSAPSPPSSAPSPPSSAPSPPSSDPSPPSSDPDFVHTDPFEIQGPIYNCDTEECECGEGFNKIICGEGTSGTWCHNADCTAGSDLGCMEDRPFACHGCADGYTLTPCSATLSVCCYDRADPEEDTVCQPDDGVCCREDYIFDPDGGVKCCPSGTNANPDKTACVIACGLPDTQKYCNPERLCATVNYKNQEEYKKWKSTFEEMAEVDSDMNLDWDDTEHTIYYCAAKPNCSFSDGASFPVFATSSNQGIPLFYHGGKPNTTFEKVVDDDGNTNSGAAAALVEASANEPYYLNADPDKKEFKPVGVYCYANNAGGIEEAENLWRIAVKAPNTSKNILTGDNVLKTFNTCTVGDYLNNAPTNTVRMSVLGNGWVVYLSNAESVQPGSWTITCPVESVPVEDCAACYTEGEWEPGKGVTCEQDSKCTLCGAFSFDPGSGTAGVYNCENRQEKERVCTEIIPTRPVTDKWENHLPYECQGSVSGNPVGNGHWDPGEHLEVISQRRDTYGVCGCHTDQCGQTDDDENQYYCQQRWAASTDEDAYQTALETKTLCDKSCQMTSYCTADTAPTCISQTYANAVKEQHHPEFGYLPSCLATPSGCFTDPVNKKPVASCQLGCMAFDLDAWAAKMGGYNYEKYPKLTEDCNNYYTAYPPNMQGISAAQVKEISKKYALWCVDVLEGRAVSPDVDGSLLNYWDPEEHTLKEALLGLYTNWWGTETSTPPYPFAPFPGIDHIDLWVTTAIFSLWFDIAETPGLTFHESYLKMQLWTVEGKSAYCVNDLVKQLLGQFLPKAKLAIPSAIPDILRR